MSKVPPPIELPPEFTDWIAVEHTRDPNHYDKDWITNNFTTYLVINGERIEITPEQGRAILRNRDQLVEATENRIIKLLEQKAEEPCCCFTATYGDHELPELIALIKGEQK